MIHLGLTKEEQEAFDRALLSSHLMRTRISIRDQHEVVVGPLTGRITSGVVNVDADADVTRSLSITLVDDDAVRRYAFVPDSPAEGALFADNYLAVRRDTWVPELDRWVSVPVFFGPIVNVERTGREVSVEAQGKESLQRDPHVVWENTLVPQGTYLTEAIRTVLAKNGEARFDLGPPKRRLRAPLMLPRMGEPWMAALSVAEGVNRHLFYDGVGRVRYRGFPRRPVWRFHQGEGGNVKGEPTMRYDLSEVRNTVEVVGPEPEGKGARVRAVAQAPKTHPLSAYALRRNGQPRYMVEHIENSEITRTEEAQEIADQQLEERLQTTVDAQFQALPAPHLEEYDLVSINDGGTWVDFRLTKFTIPLTADDDMSVGFLVKPPRLVRRKGVA